ncbi:MAG TPA: leucyl aminopeptidase [Blastocatellia bacterium]|nr:leucyl aminopeptidase [Blastocatellia bacterium]
MKIDVRAAAASEIAVDALIAVFFEDEALTEGPLAELDAALDGALTSCRTAGELHGRRDEVTYLHAPNGVAAGRLVLVGMGRREADRHQIARAIGVGVRYLRGKRHGSIGVVDRAELGAAQFGELVAESVEIAAVDLSAYKTEDRNDLVVASCTLQTSADRLTGVSSGVERGAIVADAMNYARELGNEPGDKMTPRILADRAAELAREFGLEVEILEDERLKELGMGALLGVARGSEEPARLIVLRYEPAKADDSEVLALVGKGITFDTGGISIKPREGMEWMKYDMCGGAAVLGAMRAIARLKPNRRVMGLVAAAENMPSGKAIKPGDVLRSYSGKTIEVLNTDAEGRLVLSDALTYAIEKGATRIVDLATLTGACVIALGHVYAGLMTNDQPWADGVLAAARSAGEKIWQLPLDKAYRELIRSDIADIKNLGGRTAGTITAGYFLREFVGSTPWVHLDIAGTAWVEEDRPDIARGATGFGVSTLVELVSPAAS